MPLLVACRCLYRLMRNTWTCLIMSVTLGINEITLLVITSSCWFQKIQIHLIMFASSLTLNQRFNANKVILSCWWTKMPYTKFIRQICALYSECIQLNRNFFRLVWNKSLYSKQLNILWFTKAVIFLCYHKCMAVCVVAFSCRKIPLLRKHPALIFTYSLAFHGIWWRKLYQKPISSLNSLSTQHSSEQ